MKKRILSLLLAFAIVLSLAPVMGMMADAAENWYTSGNGTEATPYIISNYSQLNSFAAYVNAGNNCANVSIKLADDFESDGTLNTGIAAKGWQSFNGKFDGNHKNVKLNIVITADDLEQYNKNVALYGLFGNLDGSAEVKNVTTSGLVSATLTGNDCQNCQAYIGGVIGRVCSGCSVSNCSSTTKVYCGNFGDNAACYVGGVIGYCGCYLSNCYYSGNAETGISVEMTKSQWGSSYVGGVVGRSENAAISNCYTSGSCSVTMKSAGNVNLGGVVGESQLVLNCYTGSGVEVSGTSSSTQYQSINVGGVVGNSYFAVYNCYSQAKSVSGCIPKGNATAQIGGIAGNAKVYNCYYSGKTPTVSKNGSDKLNDSQKKPGQIAGFTDETKSCHYIKDLVVANGNNISGNSEYNNANKMKDEMLSGLNSYLNTTSKVNYNGKDYSLFAWKQSESKNNGLPYLFDPESHVHAWTYATGGTGKEDTLLAYCTADDCSGVAVSAETAQTLTIAAPEHTKFGDGKEAKATIQDSKTSLGGVTTLPAIQYQTKTG